MNPHYRGITVGGVIGKPYATSADQQLGTWAEDAEIMVDRFRGAYTTTDNE